MCEIEGWQLLYFETCTSGNPLVDSTFTLALVTGQSVTDVSQSVLANLGWDAARLPAPLFEGETVITFKRTSMVYRRGHTTKIARISTGGDE